MFDAISETALPSVFIILSAFKISEKAKGGEWSPPSCATAWVASSL
jgi:hypothetical protein